MKPLYSMGFSIVELVVTLGVISIVLVSVVVIISPAQRISDAKDSKAKQDIRDVAYAVELCLSYSNPSTGTVNDAGFCGSISNLTGYLQGGPFIRNAVPSAVSIGYSGDVVCIWETYGSMTWKYASNVGRVFQGSPGCP